MTDKPDLKLIDAAASDDPFDLSRLRITRRCWKPPASKNC